MELEPRHRCSRQSAGRRDTDQLRELTGDGISLERLDDSGCDQEDRRDRGERELEAGIEEGVRIPTEQDSRADQQRLPAVPLASREPGE